MRSISIKNFFMLLILATMCWLTVEIHEMHRDGLREQAEHCAQYFCEGDKIPVVDRQKYSLFKIDGKFYEAPAEYGGDGGGGGALSFFWPSRAPGARGNLAPEFVPSSRGRVSNFYDVGIEIFISSAYGYGVPGEPHDYKFLKMAEINGWIASRRTLRDGLDEYRMKHIMDSHGYHIDYAVYFVATKLVGVDGEPPVASCGESNVDSRGGTGFIWKPGVWVGVRMNHRHCSDWPEIYRELAKILQQVKEVQ